MAWYLAFLVDRLADQLEPVRDLVQRFGVPDDEKAIARQVTGEALKQHFLGFFRKIDHHIAAKDNVELAAHRPLIH